MTDQEIVDRGKAIIEELNSLCKDAHDNNIQMSIEENGWSPMSPTPYTTFTLTMTKVMSFK